MIFGIKRICQNGVKKGYNFEPKDSESVETQLKLEHILFVLTKYEENELLLIFRRHYILEI